MKNHILSLSFLFLFTSLAQAAPFTVETKEGKSTFDIDDSFSAEQSMLMKNALVKLSRVATEVGKSNYLIWVSERVTRIRPAPETEEHAGATAYYEDQSIFVKPVFFESYNQSDFQISILVHEARHSDPYPHVMCSRKLSPKLRPEMKKQIACDGNEMGAYGTQFIFLIDLMKQNLNTQNLEADLKDLGVRILDEKAREKLQNTARTVFPDFSL